MILGLAFKRIAAALLVLALLPAAAHGSPAPRRIAVLARGINITGWFRFPGSRDPAVLAAWLSDAAMADIKRAGFTFVRLAVDPAILAGPADRGVLIGAVRRLQKHGLAVMIAPHPVSWQLDTSEADRARFTAFWRALAPELRGLDPELTFPEILNEPVFAASPADWAVLQHGWLTTIRAALPSYTIVLTGQDWGSIGGLLALKPEADGNVVYSFHFYDPAELTALAAYRPGLDRSALARLPFPGGGAACSEAAARASDAATSGLMRFYCASGWDESRIRGRIQDAANWAKRNDTRVIAGEFGASVALNPAARLAWLRLVRETCAAAGIGWALWGYDDGMGLNVPRPPASRPVLDRSVLVALGFSGG